MIWHCREAPSQSPTTGPDLSNPKDNA
jgi:hypothetical protein